MDAASRAPGAFIPQVDIVLAPATALERIREAPAWLASFVVASVLSIIGFTLQRPAQLHASLIFLGSNGATSGVSDEQKSALAQAFHPGLLGTSFAVFGVIANLLVSVVITCVLLLAASGLFKGAAGFRQLWASTMLIAIPTIGLGSVVLGIICSILGPNAFTSPIDLQLAVPGLSALSLVRSDLAKDLAGISFFAVWNMILNAKAMSIVAGLSPVRAWVAPVFILTSQALLTAGSLNMYH